MLTKLKINGPPGNIVARLVMRNQTQNLNGSQRLLEIWSRKVGPKYRTRSILPQKEESSIAYLEILTASQYPRGEDLGRRWRLQEEA